MANAFADSSVRFSPFDVAEPGAWRSLLAVEAPEVIIHLAAETGTGQSLRQGSRHASVNVVGTTRMTDALFEIGHVPEHVLLTSSRAVYGEGMYSNAHGAMFYPKPRSRAQLENAVWDPLDPNGNAGIPQANNAELVEPRPTNIYAATKLAQEHILRAWRDATGSKLSVLRLQNVYGSGQSVTNSYTGVLTFFARVALAKNSINIFEDGAINRDFVSVLDVAQALVRAIENPPIADRVVDIGSGSAMTLFDAANALAANAGAPAPHISGDFRDGDVRSAWADITAATRDFGYQPTVTFDEGSDHLLTWVSKGMS